MDVTKHLLPCMLSCFAFRLVVWIEPERAQTVSGSENKETEICSALSSLKHWFTLNPLREVRITATKSSLRQLVHTASPYDILTTCNHILHAVTPR